jgi:hypothetical protein
MLTLTISILAAALLAQSPHSIFASGVVIDSAGNPLSDVEVVLWGRIRADGLAPTLAQTKTDVQGAFRLEVTRQSLQRIGPRQFVWAYKPGRTVAVEVVDLTDDGAPASVRLTLAEPLRRTLTVLGPDNRPLAGVHLAPVLYASDGKALFQTPDDRLERLTITSAADGAASFSYFPPWMDPLTVRVTSPGIAPQNLALVDRPAHDRITLKLGRPTSLAGSVYDDSGQPSVEVPIEVWVESTYRMPGDPAEYRWPSPPRIRFDSGPVRTRADGSFLTPSQLLTGSSYRIVIRPDGSPPVTSDWLKATSELTTFPPFRLKQQRQMRGLVHDRKGEPVAGARVFLPSVEASTTTDAQGRYILEGVLPDKTYLLVKADGFRFQGWPDIPAREPREKKRILVRTSESTDRMMSRQPAPISRDESRALARRLLEPSLRAALEKGDDRAKWDCLRIASRMDPGRVLELLEKHPMQNAGMESSIRKMVATELLATDPSAAESIVKGLPNPGYRAWAYLELATALPDEDRARKRKLLEAATDDVHDPAVLARDPESRRVRLGQLVRAWLNLGDVDKARPLIREGMELVAVLPKQMPQFDDRFLSTAARVEPDRVLSLIGNLTSAAQRRSYYARIAEGLAYEHPAEAEHVFQQSDASPRTMLQNKSRTALQLRLCLRLATSDPVRARRIIAGIEMPQDQACGWALLALGLADRDKPAARSALAESIEVIDRLTDSAGASKPAPTRVLADHNPAALILPIVEKVAPERLEEVFWRAIALMPIDDLAQKRGVADPRIAEAAIVLARYDRQVADVFVRQAMSALSASRSVYSPVVIRAKAGVDPQGAVTLMEALPPGGLEQETPANRMMNSARDELLIYLIEPNDHHWQYVWSQTGIDFDERSFP